MKRAARILFHLSVGVSLLLFLLAVGFWIASYRRRYVAEQYKGEIPWRVIVSRGEVGVETLASAEWSGLALPQVAGWAGYTRPPDDLIASIAPFARGGRSPSSDSCSPATGAAVRR